MVGIATACQKSRDTSEISSVGIFHVLSLGQRELPWATAIERETRPVLTREADQVISWALQLESSPSYLNLKESLLSKRRYSQIKKLPVSLGLMTRYSSSDACLASLIKFLSHPVCKFLMYTQ